jgi:hypothetical protein
MSPDNKPFQTYDPFQLVTEVSDLLRKHGLAPAFPDGSAVTASTGASMLLRGLGVFPGIDAVAAYSRNTDLIWGESQDVA